MLAGAPTFLFFSHDASRVVRLQETFSLRGIRGHGRLLRPGVNFADAPACGAVGFELSDLDATLDYVRQWQEVRPAPVLVMATAFTDAQAFPLLSAAVRGLVTFDEFAGHATLALQVLVRGGYWIPRSFLTRYLESGLQAVRRSRLALQRTELNERDVALLDGILERHSDEQLSTRMGMAVDQLQAEIKRLLDFFGVRRRDDLLLLSRSPSQLSAGLGA